MYYMTIPRWTQLTIYGPFSRFATWTNSYRCNVPVGTVTQEPFRFEIRWNGVVKACVSIFALFPSGSLRISSSFSLKFSYEKGETEFDETLWACESRRNRFGWKYLRIIVLRSSIPSCFTGEKKRTSFLVCRLVPGNHVWKLKILIQSQTSNNRFARWSVKHLMGGELHNSLTHVCFQLNAGVLLRCVGGFSVKLYTTENMKRLKEHSGVRLFQALINHFWNSQVLYSCW